MAGQPAASALLRQGCSAATPSRGPALPAPDRARGGRGNPPSALGARRLTSTIVALRLLRELTLEVVRQLLPSWLLGAGAPTSHGTSRWARGGERPRLGRIAKPHSMYPDGIVLGWHEDHLIQSHAEDNVILFGVQRSGKTSHVGVPTLLGWQGAVVATSTKEELVRLTSPRRSATGPVHVFAPLDRDDSWIRQLGFEPASWNPVDAADSCGSAAELADHFTAHGQHGDSSHWYLAAPAEEAERCPTAVLGPLARVATTSDIVGAAARRSPRAALASRTGRGSQFCPRSAARRLRIQWPGPGNTTSALLPRPRPAR